MKSERRQCEAASPRRGEDRLADRVLASLLRRRGEREKLFLSDREIDGPQRDEAALVSVPVLSKTIVSTRARARAPRRPRRENRARRAARRHHGGRRGKPSAQGQAMTSTETAAMIAGSAPAPAASHAKVRSATAMTIGTKTALMRSTRRCTGAFEACADFDQRDNCAQRRLRAERSRAEAQEAIDIERAADDAVSRLFATGALSPVTSDL